MGFRVMAVANKNFGHGVKFITCAYDCRDDAQLPSELSALDLYVKIESAIVALIAISNDEVFCENQNNERSPKPAP